MIEKNSLIADRVRKIGGSFAFIEHCFLRVRNGFFQVLSLPERPVQPPSRPLQTRADIASRDPATIRRIIGQALRGDSR